MTETVIVLTVSVFLAFLTESMTEFVLGELFNHIPALEKYKWLLMYVALAVGVGLAFHYQIDLVALLERMLGGAHPDEAHGMVLSGLAIGRGANYLHQLISQFFPGRAKAGQDGST